MSLFFDTGREEKVEIHNNSQLYEYASRLISVIDQYEKITTPPQMLEQ